MNNRWSSALVVVMAALLASVSGCCTVDPGPFDALSASTKSLLDGADRESVEIGEVQRTFFVFAAAAGKLEKDSFEPTVKVGGRQQNTDSVRQFNERIAILEFRGFVSLLMPVSESSRIGKRQMGRGPDRRRHEAKSLAEAETGSGDRVPRMHGG